MKRIFFITLLLCISTCCYGCICQGNKNNDKWDFDGGKQIIAISIVELGEFDQETYTHAEVCIAEIKDKQDFVDDFNKVDSNRYWGDPCQPQIGDVVIKFVYEDGGYDFVGADAQCKHRTSPGGYGRLWFDEQQFNSLIAKYTPDDTKPNNHCYTHC